MMTIENLSSDNLNQLIGLVLELWTDCQFEEEYDNYQSLIDADKEIFYLVKDDENYIAFIHLSLRFDYVEGTTDSPVAYLEAVYVKPSYQKRGIAKKLVAIGAEWGRQKGCKELASDVEIMNLESIGFHQKIGFEEVNRVVCFIKKL
jgi:aminoglycoside 6'-N-acetyltransferase I